VNVREVWQRGRQGLTDDRNKATGHPGLSEIGDACETVLFGVWDWPVTTAEDRKECLSNWKLCLSQFNNRLSNLREQNRIQQSEQGNKAV
jgi:hypothetical protein